MTDSIDILVRYYPSLLRGALVTLQLAAIAWGGGLVAGTLLGVIRASADNRAQNILSWLALALSSIPILVYLLWGHYPFQSALGITLPPFLTAAVIFTIYNALVISETVKGAIQDIPVAYSLAAQVSGIPRSTFIRHISIPLAFRSALPSYLVSQVAVLHLTLFASLISVPELFRVAQRINANEYNAVGVYSLLAIFYFILSFPILLVAKYAERRLAKIGLER